MKPGVAHELAQLAAIVTVNPELATSEIHVGQHGPCTLKLAGPVHGKLDVTAKLNGITVAGPVWKVFHDLHFDKTRSATALGNDVGPAARRVHPSLQHPLGAQKAPAAGVHLLADGINHGSEFDVTVASERCVEQAAIAIHVTTAAPGRDRNRPHARRSGGGRKFKQTEGTSDCHRIE